jgi:eukaryotic-like serine/threonine-protein kinase
MTPATPQCEFIVPLLSQSLDDLLSEQQERQMTEHLAECKTCQHALETLAGDAKRWKNVGDVLRSETSAEHANRNPGITRLLPIQSQTAAGNDESPVCPGVQPGDFVVDFLQPSLVRESLGRLGNVEIRQFIGQGAHGIVFKGFQDELNRLVAVKVMAPYLASSVAARKRFAREARATAAIVHPNVMPILHVDSSGQLPYLVMPYVDCESLQQRLDRESTLPLPDVLRIGLQVAHGLAAAHAQGLVHRDVKPANILLERGVERVMLTDFGLARAVDDGTLTRSGLIAGTPHYMSPEQARGDTVDVRSDLFCLGSVLYAMAVGRPPFRAETTYGILRRVTDDEPRSLCELNTDLPRWFESVVLKLLRKSAADRFGSAQAVAKLLEDCLAHLAQPDAVPLPTVVQQLSTTQHAPINLRLAAWLAVPAIVVIIIVVAVIIGPLWSVPGPESDNVQATSSEGEAQRESVTSSPEEFVAADYWIDGLDVELEQLNSDISILDEATMFDE